MTISCYLLVAGRSSAPVVVSSGGLNRESRFFRHEDRLNGN
jgi:hypothetical protein